MLEGTPSRTDIWWNNEITRFPKSRSDKWNSKWVKHVHNVTCEIRTKSTIIESSHVSIREVAKSDLLSHIDQLIRIEIL